MTGPPDGDGAAGREEILLRVFAAPHSERRQLLEELCGENTALRGELEAILAWRSEAGHALASLEDALEPSRHVPDPDAPPCIPRFRLLRPLGSGGMGAVWLAEQLAPFHRQVAVKVVRSGRDNDEVVARFRGECQALALMDHDGIAKIYEAGTTADGDPYFAMEYVEGPTLTGHCEDHELGIHDRLRLFLQVCEAVEHAHSRGLIHRDLKPSNIVVAPRPEGPRAKIIDFGVAKALHGRLHDATQPGRRRGVVGTPSYMSPEQRDDRTPLGPRADVWSLGATLHELLTGRSPHPPEEDEPEREPPPRPLPPALEKILARCMAEDPDARYPSAAALAGDVRRYLSGGTVRARPATSRLYRLLRYILRHPVHTAALLAVAVALTASAVHLRGLARERSRDDAARDRQLARLQASETLDRAWLAGRSGELERARDLLQQSADAARAGAILGFGHRHLASRLHLEIPELRLPGHRIDHVFFLPGERIGCAGGIDGAGQTQMAVWSIATRELTESGWPREYAFELCDARLSPDGQSVVMASRSAPRLWRVDLATGRTTGRCRLGRAASLIAFSPDGRLRASAYGTTDIALHRFPEEREVARWHAHPSGDLDIRCLGFASGGRLLVTATQRSCRVWRLPRSLLGDDPAAPEADAERVAEHRAPHGDRISAAACTDDAVVLGHRDGSIELRTPLELELRERVEARAGMVTALAVLGMGDRLATAHADGDIVLWRTGSLETLASYRAHANHIIDLEPSADGRLLASVDLDGVARLWPLDEGHVAVAVATVEDRLWDLAFDGDGRLVSESGSPAFTAWDTERGSRAGNLIPVSTVQREGWSGEGELEHDVCRLSPRGHLVAMSTPERTVRLFPTRPEPDGRHARGVELTAFPAGAPVYGMGFSPDGAYFAASGVELRATSCTTRLRVWRHRTRTSSRRPWRRVFDVETGVASRDILVLPRQGLVVHGGQYGTPMEVLRLHDGDRVARFRAQSFVGEIAATPDGDGIITLGEDGSLQIWSTPDAERPEAPERRLATHAHGARVNDLAFFPDGRQLVTASADGAVRLWWLLEEEGKLRLLESLELPGPRRKAKAVAVRDDGRVLAAAANSAGGDRGRIRVWYGLGEDAFERDGR